MKNRTLLALAVLSVSSLGHAEEFRFTVANLGPQPLSPVFYSAGDSTFDIFQVGGMASIGIKNIAELGDATAMLGIAANAGNSVMSFGALGNTPLLPGESRSTTFSTDSAHGMFSFASMLGKTNDGFIGESVSSKGLSLFTNGAASGFTLEVFGARAWDAGTEVNTQNAADLIFLGGQGNPLEGGTIGVHGTVVPGVGDSWQLMPDWELTTHLATVTVEVVPEPLTLVAFGTALASFLKRRKRTN